MRRATSSDSVALMVTLFWFGGAGNFQPFPNDDALIIIIIIILVIIIIIIVPVIIGTTGIVTRSLRKNLEAVPGKHSIDSLQKTAILGTVFLL